MRNIVCLLLISASLAFAGPVTFTSIPQDFQFYPRNIKANTAKAEVRGLVTDPGYKKILLVVFRDGVETKTLKQRLKYKDDGASFSFSHPIKAELANYDLEVVLLKGREKTSVIRVKDLVAGDVFLMNGQSNCEARSFNGSANGNQSSFLRSFGSRVHNGNVAHDLAWHTAEGDAVEGAGAVGQWGLRMGALLIEKHQIPIAILNGALGGQPIEHFTRRDDDRQNLDTNYGRLLFRCAKAGVSDHVRAILWYQGESDHGHADKHENGFIKLYESWLEDYPSVERVYVEQLRVGCGVDKNNVELRDRQRRLPEKHPGIAVMSTTGIDAHDGCHYSYTDGYEIIGYRNARLLSRDLYGSKDTVDVEAPNPARAYFATSDHTILTIDMHNKRDAMVWSGEAHGDFRIEGSNIQVTGGKAKGSKILLRLSGDASGASGVTYTGHAGAGPWVTNKSGVGLLTFANLPIEKAAK